MRSVRMYCAAIGALAHASPRFVQIAASMGFAVSAVKDTEQKTTNSASLSSRLATERELLGLWENVALFTEKGPRPLNRPLKRKASVILEPPRFCRGFVWTDNSIDLISPSALVFKGPVHRTAKKPQLNRTELQKVGPSVAVRASQDGRTAPNRTDKNRFESVRTATVYSS
jgi:hypothetical protein